MWLLTMAWKNLWRNYTRTHISMSAIFFAVILSVLTSSLKDGVFDNLVKNVVSFYTGYIQVHKTGYWNEQNLDNSFTASAKTEQIILSDNNISSITSRLESFALVSVITNSSHQNLCAKEYYSRDKEPNPTGVKIPNVFDVNQL